MYHDIFDVSVRQYEADRAKAIHQQQRIAAAQRAAGAAGAESTPRLVGRVPQLGDQPAHQPCTASAAG